MKKGKEKNKKKHLEKGKKKNRKCKEKTRKKRVREARIFFLKTGRKKR